MYKAHTTHEKINIRANLTYEKSTCTYQRALRPYDRKFATLGNSPFMREIMENKYSPSYNNLIRM